MSDHTPETQDTSPEASQDGQINPSRRKLAGAALGVSAIFTLASRPVLAAQCMSPSAAVSGNLSQHGTPPSCSGRSPGYWKQRSGDWPSPYTAGSCSAGNACNKVQNWTGGTLFHPMFSGTLFMADLDGKPLTPKTSLSMVQVMMLGNGNGANPWGLTDPDNLGMHIAAALLNAKAGLTPVLSETDVINMWNEWATKGYFEPVANVKWNSKQIVDYLKTTMI